MDDRLDEAWTSDEIDLAAEPDFSLGSLRLSPSARELRWTDGRESVQPRVMQALVCLARAEGAVVSRDELIRRCWGGRIVGEDAINRCIAKARQLAEVAGEPAFTIETIPRVGYRLRCDSAPPSAPAAGEPARAGGRARPWRLAAAAVLLLAGAAGVWLLQRPRPAAAAPPPRSVAILPIRNLTGEASLDTAAERLTEDVSYIVGRSGYITVAPRTATAGLKSAPVDAAVLGRSLGVRYVVVASLRRDDAGYRVNYQMVDTATGQGVDTQDLGVPSPTGALPEPQLALRANEAIVGAIDRRWSAAELARPPDDRDPENLLARMHGLIEHPAARDIGRTERLLGVAGAEIPKDSALAPEFDTMACWYYLSLLQGGFDTSAAERTRWAATALDFGRRAVDAKPDMTGGHGCLAEVYVQTRQWDAGMSEAQYVITTYAMASSIYYARGDMELAKGRFADALRDYREAAIRSGEPASNEGLARLMIGQPGPAIAALRQGTAIMPSDASSYFYLAAAYEMSGDHADALAAADQYRKLRSDNSAWRTLAMSDEPAFLGPAAKVRAALARAGLAEAKLSAAR
ncbi:MAG TPA: winged helix-turn-helix domain-containing protein [Caulobacteraceae bacterium]|jgi:DNA-binding winged helix-turn-helix (wHTH) protein/TolB-like protein/tetratricopeptide (TPR) repeat protein